MFELFEGDHRDGCSVDEFLYSMPHRPGSGLCQKLPPESENNPYRVFWYPDCTSNPSVYAGSTEEKVIGYLLSLGQVDHFNDSLMIQLWTPERSSSGVVMLTVAGQPFAIRPELCKGLCRYRYSCMQHDIEAGDTTNTNVGPIAKIFTEGFPEYFEYHERVMSSFSSYDFAQTCGIGDDWNYAAFPIFECDNARNRQEQECVGVLEVLSYSSSPNCPPKFWDFAASLKITGIECIRLDLLECFDARRCALKSKVGEYLMHYVKVVLKSPMIQIWRPSYSPTYGLLCTWESMESMDISIEPRLNCDYILQGTCSWKIPNPLIRKVHSRNQACFIKDTSKLSISDYPFVQFTISNGLKACFIFTLKTIHPKLHPLVLQVFLPRLQNLDHGNFLAQLKSLLSTVARTLSICNSSYGLQENEEFIFSNSHSEDDNVIFFDVHRGRKSMAADVAIGHGREDGGQNCEIHEVSVITTMDNIVIRGDDKVSEDVRIIEEMRGFLSFNQEKQQFPPTLEDILREDFFDAEENVLDEIPSGEEVEAVTETLDSNLVKSHGMLGSSIQDMAVNSKETCTIDDDEITLDIINQYRGHAKLADVARELKVSRATLKRRCRKLGIPRWPYCKRNEVQEQCSNNNEEAAAAGSITARIKGKSNIVAGNHEIDRGFPLTVKASCRGDTAKFPFYSNSGIEELRRDMVKRFELEGGKFKIKYKDEDEDGEWIILSCNEDLLFHMETLKALGQSTMRLSVFPVTM